MTMRACSAEPRETPRSSRGVRSLEHVSEKGDRFLSERNAVPCTLFNPSYVFELNPYRPALGELLGILERTVFKFERKLSQFVYTL